MDVNSTSIKSISLDPNYLELHAVSASLHRQFLIVRAMYCKGQGFQIRSCAGQPSGYI